MTNARQSRRTQSVPEQPTGTPVLTAKQFIKQYIRNQIILMDGMVQMIVNGDIVLDEDGADALIEGIMGHWMSLDDPDFKTQMRAQAAMFLDELLEAVYAARHGVAPESKEEVPPVQESPGYTELAVEVLKTVRSIWGRS